MPQVPGAGLYGARRVGQDPLPAARKTAAETPESQGAGVALARARTAETIGAVGGMVARMGADKYRELQEKERDRADEIAFLGWQRRAGEWELDKVNGDNGVLQVKGKDAQGLPEAVLGDWDKFASTLEAEAKTDRQKLALARLLVEKRAHLDLTVRRHVFQQLQQYQAQEVEGTLQNVVAMAGANALDPARVNLEMQRGIAVIDKHAADLGVGPEAKQAQILALKSNVHEVVIRRMLANGKDKMAGIYFTEAQSEIAPEKIGSLEQAVKEGGAISNAQRTVDSIIAGGGTLTDWRAAVRAKLEGRERELAMDMLTEESAVRDRARRETEEKNLRGALDVIDGGGSLRQVMRQEAWGTFTIAERNGLRNYAEQVARGVPVQTDLPTYYALLSRAVDDPDFVEENLLKYRHKLGESEFKQLAGVQLELRRNNKKAADEILSGPSTALQTVNSALEEHGINSNPKDGSAESAAVAQLRRMVDRRIEDIQNAPVALGGKPVKLLNQDIRAIVDEILLKPATVPGSFWNFWPGGRSVGDQQVRVIDVRDVRDIPTATRTEIEEKLTKNGVKPTDALMLAVYREMLWSSKK